MNSSAGTRVAAGAGSVLAVTVIFSILAAPASRATDSVHSTPATVIVEYGDLNLSSIEGVNVLKARIRGAAERVCDRADSRSLEAAAQVHRCVSQATSQALDKVGVPRG
jgi:UrcA family protein